jgi:trigger factor
MSSAATKATAPTGASAIKVKVSARPASRVALELAIPAARSQASYEAAVEKLSRSIKLPGFRKGKVPRPVLLQQIGPMRIRATALEDLVDAAFRDALDVEKVAAIGRPELSEGFEVVLERFDPGNELTFTLELDVEPTPKLKATKGLKAEAESVSYDPARVDELIEQSRKQLATLVPVDGRAAQAADVPVCLPLLCPFPCPCPCPFPCPSPAPPLPVRPTPHGPRRTRSRPRRSGRRPHRIGAVR